jgi:GNAT superfamily N-acetyltransferase
MLERYKITAEHPYGASAAVMPIEGHPDVFLLQNVQVFPGRLRRQGYGTQLIERITQDADEESAVLDLVACPGCGPGLSLQELIGWYERHGWELIEDPINEKPLSNYMRRLPQ